MRNKPWVNDFLDQYPGKALVDPLLNKGKWHDLLAVETLHVEIGSGKGDYWLTMAHDHPDEGWIGIEKERNCAAIALKKALDEPLDNTRFIIGDAQDISTWFETKEIDTIHLNFSDPWPKNRNTKRRLTHQGFLKQYHDILNDNGLIIMKTDNKRLFEFSLISMQLDWLLTDVSVDFRRIQQDDAITEYEHKFMEDGLAIYRAVWQKRLV